MLTLPDPYAHRDSTVHRLDPRAKVLAALSLIALAGLLPDGAWIPLAWLGALGAAASSLAHLGPTYGARRCTLALPFVLAALPLPFVVPGETVGTMLGLPVSDAGLIRCGTILARTAVSVQATVLLVATTRLGDLLWGLGRMGLPAPLVRSVGMLGRYLAVLQGEAGRMMVAREVRSAPRPGSRPPGPMWQAGVAGAMVGTLWLRSLARSERVHAAMLARGYDGGTPALHRPAWNLQDTLALAAWTVLLGGALAPR